MRFDWDPNKQPANRRKHGIAFADAVAVYRDPGAIRIISARKADPSERDQYRS